MPKRQGYKLQVTGYSIANLLRRCSQVVYSLRKARAQLGKLCPQSTTRRKYLTSQGLFIHRPSTNTSALDTVFARWFWKNQSIKFSYTHFTQGLLMQLSKGS